MSTNKTPNLSLHSWEEADRFTRTEFNENFAAIDAAVGDLDAAVGTIDAAVAANALAATAAQSAASAAQATADIALAAASAATEERGSVKLVWGEYVGDDTSGPEHPNTLVFDGRPLRVTVYFPSMNLSEDGLDMYRPVTSVTAKTPFSSTSRMTVSWGEKSVSWYENSGGNCFEQFNDSAFRYWYLALVAM